MNRMPDRPLQLLLEPKGGMCDGYAAVPQVALTARAPVFLTASMMASMLR